MATFNTEEVAEVEGFEEWTEQHQSGDGDENEGVAVAQENQTQQHHIMEGAVMLSATGEQVVLMDAEAVDGRVYSRPSATSEHFTGTSTLCCSSCNMIFPSKAAFFTHQRREHQNTMLPSSTSGTPSPSTTVVADTAEATGDALTASSEAARRSHICSLCNKGFTTSSNLHQHRRLHFNERPFQCNQCNKGFATSTNLKQHYRTHTGDRPYPCMYCPKRFATNSNLRQHIRTHTGERPHVCVYPGCGRGFNDATKLSNHKRTHTGERPFICAVCGNEFVTRNNLKSHMRSHYDPKKAGQRQKDQRGRAKHGEAVDHPDSQQLQPRNDISIQTVSRVVRNQKVAQCCIAQCQGDCGQNKESVKINTQGVDSTDPYREVGESAKTLTATKQGFVMAGRQMVEESAKTRGSVIVVRLRAASPIGRTN